jgi:hypothetical protein
LIDFSSHSGGKRRRYFCYFTVFQKLLRVMAPAADRLIDLFDYSYPLTTVVSAICRVGKSGSIRGCIDFRRRNWPTRRKSLRRLGPWATVSIQFPVPRGQQAAAARGRGGLTGGGELKAADAAAQQVIFDFGS